MSTSEEKLRSRETFHLDQIAAINAEFVEEGFNDDNRFWQKARLFAKNISSRYTKSGLPVVYYEVHESWTPNTLVRTAWRPKFCTSVKWARSLAGLRCQPQNHKKKDQVNGFGKKL
ncbi:uncharacterized protein ACLA_071300 [Aspergillus clavatus NRRL 1]|uniref:Uncharacterized protein n=1 Tax=Aspergillus clavatus (strain ATCC 1007 / CBS 513.65 / DSM 816 / NCTC 3887 / NRRL 1 / QM 1276 / 107) TaxID=344612 RepID=A1C6S6_ASPCL|nr:uncharacterized protein ACLA_071300 [Aspergillus clavatus NRRL 1]EAW14097.1 hypothetical protein ACLA_071300 [Aspergillus clavatus NRRL 1]